MANTVIRLVTAQTRDILKLETRTAGTYLVDLLIEGNSLLSTVFVKSISGSVEVNYHESTTGRDFSERKELQGHPVISAPNAADPSKITITPFHNSPQCEVIVTGTAEFSVFATVVNTFASDLDAALQFDGETWQPTVDKGLPAMCLDETTGLLNFLRCDANGLIVSGTFTPGEAGTPFYRDGTTSSLAPLGTVVTLDSFTVPALTTRKFRKVWVTSNHPGVWTIDAGGSIIATGRIHPGHPDSDFSFDPIREVGSSTLVKLNYCARSGRDSSDVSWHIMASDFT